MVRTVVLTGICALVGCSTEAPVIDPFPVRIDLDTGVVLVPVTTVAAADPADQVMATIDTLSPFTVVDSYQPGDEFQTPRRRQVDLTLYDATAPTVARARFDSVSALDLHPCPDQSMCRVGADGDTAEIGAIIGGDVLSRVAVRFEFPSATVRFFPDIAGDDAARGRACDAVFSRPFAGGGTVSIAGAEVTFSPLRIAVGTCLHYDTETPDAILHGSAALLLIATGLSTTILSESAYRRYADLVADPTVAPAIDDLPPVSLHVSSGTSSSTITGRLGSVTRIALVGGEGSNIRGPCQELWNNHVMAREACYDGDAGITGFPCDETRFSSTAAAIELAAPIQVAVVSDLEPLLQSLRDQLRPKLPEVDGLLGVDAMSKLGIDLDYPNNRVVMRCLDTTDCLSRPAVRTRTSLPDILGCPGMP